LVDVNSSNVIRGCLRTPVVGVVRVSSSYNSSTGAAFEMLEQTAPAAGDASSARIFAQDNGSGKTQLMVQFGTGAAQQIAIEP